jgi:hypothetical protein
MAMLIMMHAMMIIMMVGLSDHDGGKLHCYWPLAAA